MPEDPDPDDDAARVEATGVEAAAGGLDEDPLAVEELDEPELPQPATARQTNTSAPLVHRRIDPDIALVIA